MIAALQNSYPRDLAGYGHNPPHAQWPDGARVALQFVLNYEEGSENCVLHGDKTSETFLSEIIGAQAFEMRHMSMESLYEYGSRAGLWRLLRMFEDRQLPLTVFGVAMALQRNPDAVAALNRGIEKLARRRCRRCRRVPQCLRRQCATAIRCVGRELQAPRQGISRGGGTRRFTGDATG